MENIQADSLKMNREETEQSNQSVMDTNVPNFFVGIKEELVDETGYIQSQFPFQAEKLKQEKTFIKSEEITSFDDVYMKVRKVDSFDETMTELEKVEQPGLYGHNIGRHYNNNESCASTWSYFTDSKKINSLDNGQHSQLVGHDTDSEKLTGVIEKTEKNTEDVVDGLERIPAHMRLIVKNIDEAVDLEGLQEYVHFERTTDEAGSFEKRHVHAKHTKISTENKTGDLCLTSREQRLNVSVKVRECQVILEDIMTKITHYEDSLSLHNGRCRKLSDNAFCVSKSGTKHNVSSVGSDKLARYNVCGVGFIMLSRLNIHTGKHTEEKSYKCDICGKHFTNTSCLNAHKIKHVGKKPYTCDVCSKGFTKKCYLTVHKRLHTGEKPYQCDVCGKLFIKINHLNRHKIIHTGKKPYQCDVCDNRFADISVLKSHKRIHTGQKPYQCNVCGRCFIQSSVLNYHKILHTGEKPYVCVVCGKCFANKRRLTAHKRIHTGEKPCKCDVCCKCFINNSTLRAHKKIHTGEKPYKCDVCCKCFINNSSLHAHKRIHTEKKHDVCLKMF